MPGKTSASPPVTRPWCGAAARSRGADRRARAARPSAPPRARVRSRGGGPPRSAARASTGVRRPGRWGKTGLSHYGPWCASVMTDPRGSYTRLSPAQLGRRRPLQAASRTARRSTGSVHCSRRRCGRRLAPVCLLCRDRLVHRTPLGDPLIYRATLAVRVRGIPRREILEPGAVCVLCEGLQRF